MFAELAKLHPGWTVADIGELTFPQAFAVLRGWKDPPETIDATSREDIMDVIRMVKEGLI